MKNNMAVMAVIVLAVAAGGFYAGMKYQETRRFSGSVFVNGGSGSMRFRGEGGKTMGARQVMGEIIESDDSSITVKTQDGSTRIIMVSDKTPVNKAEKGSREDLKTGVTVAVFGSDNTDGSVTAQNIQLNPGARMMKVPTPDAGK